ncbi:MAG: hypothetical protein FWF10_06235 [Clostridiales bacterium]|nr:hypothetical protein [Clostridiales bacterium]
MDNTQKPAWKLAIRAILFVFIFALLFFWVSYLLRPVDIYRETVTGYYAEPNNSLDMVFVGGSVCFKSWAPLVAWDTHGFTSYDFATDALPPQLIRYYVAETLKSQSPVLLLIDLRPFEFGDKTFERGIKYMHREAALRRGIDSFSYSFNRLDMINSSVPKNYPRLQYVFDIAKYHTNIDKLTADNLRYSFNRWPSPTKGFTILTEHMEAVRYDYADITETKALSETMETLLRELLIYLQGIKSIQVLFIVTPYSLYVAEDQMLHNEMARLVREYGFDYLDCNGLYDEIGLDFAVDYYDNSHVNVAGALKFTRFLAAYLAARYALPDRRNDPAYETWQRASERFATELGEALSLLQENIGSEGYIDAP